MRALFYAVLVLCTSATFLLPGQAAGPTGISFDQIDRFGFGHSSEAFGSFQKDRTALVAAASQNRFPAVNGGPSQQLLGSATLGMTGTLLHYAYLDGMTRIDDPIQDTATITRPDLHEVLYLNLAKKTYRVANLPARALTVTIPAEMQRTLHQLAASQPHFHGNAIETVKTSNVTLPPATYETFPVTGARTVASTIISKATGACHDINMQIAIVQYDIPQFAEPSRDGRALMAHAATTMPRRAEPPLGGCQPKRIGTATPQLTTFGGKSFNVYREIETRSVVAGITTPVTFFVSERGNIRRLTEADRSWFSPPAEYTKEAP